MRLKAPKKPFVRSLCGRRSIAQRAGESERAFMVEKITDTDIVTANCWNNLADIPPEKEIGMNTANSTMVVAMIGEVTFLIASSVASAGLIPRSIFACDASTTTIASSTTSPTESTSPSSETIFMVKPSSGNIINVPMIDTGMAIRGISVALQLCRKRKMMRITNMRAMIKVSNISRIPAEMLFVPSTKTSNSTPSGIRSAIVAIFSLTALPRATALEFGSW